MAENVTTIVWRLHGATGSEPGVLTYADGSAHLQIEDHAGALNTAFQVPLSDIVDVKWPRLQFSAGCSFSVGEEKFRLSFVQPQNTRAPHAAGAVAGVGSIGKGRAAGKTWRGLLS